MGYQFAYSPESERAFPRAIRALASSRMTNARAGPAQPQTKPQSIPRPAAVSTITTIGDVLLHGRPVTLEAKTKHFPGLLGPVRHSRRAKRPLADVPHYRDLLRKIAERGPSTR